MKSGTKAKDFGPSIGQRGPTGKWSTLPTKALCELNLNNRPSEFRIT
jgi:hypothetical protein